MGLCKLGLWVLCCMTVCHYCYFDSSKDRILYSPCPFVLAAWSLSTLIVRKIFHALNIFIWGLNTLSLASGLFAVSDLIIYFFCWSIISLIYHWVSIFIWLMSMSELRWFVIGLTPFSYLSSSPLLVCEMFNVFLAKFQTSV